MNKTLAQIIADADTSLPSRCGYARDVLSGYQRWSGADLQGKARKYSSSYERQRRRARGALHNAGGRLVYLRRAHGLLVAAAAVCTDDYGTEVYETLRHGYVPATDLS